jgi:hypothetical protein
MAFDSMPGGDPRGPVCPKCDRPITADQPATIMHFQEDPYGDRGMSGRRWHAACARPLWDTVSSVLKSLDDLTGRF